MSTFLNTTEDMKWLREVHLHSGVAHRWRITNSEGDSQRDGPYFGDYTEFGSAVLSGNEDNPASVDLYVSNDPAITDGFVRWISE